MRRRTLHIPLIVAIALLSVGEAYHYHPDGGAWWQFVGSPFAASSSTGATDADTHATQNNPAHTCLLHFWSSLLSTTSISLPVVLAPPARANRLSDHTSHATASGTTLPLSIRGPPAILS